MSPALYKFVLARPGGFLRDTDMPELNRLDRLCPVLVRCGSNRFTCGAQYLEGMIRAIESVGDYVRDVSFPCSVIDEARSAALADGFTARV